MSYDSCPYQTVLNLACSYAGTDPTQLTNTQTNQINAFIAQRLKDWAWVAWPWPQVTLVEQRQYRPNYDNSKAYPAPVSGTPQEVYFPPGQQYYQALCATTGNPPATYQNGGWVVDGTHWAVCAGPYVGAFDWTASTAYALGTIVRNPTDGLYYQCYAAGTSGSTFSTAMFGLLTIFDPYIAWNQSWQANTVGEFLGVYLDNPDLDRIPRRISYRVDGIGAHVLTSPFSRWGRGIGYDYLVPNMVYLVFRLPAPVFVGNLYSGTATYVAGQDSVYFSGTTTALAGDFYNCIGNTTAGQSPQTTPASWQVVPFPKWLAAPVARRAYADFLRYNAMREVADREDVAADDTLYQEQIRQGGQQGQILKWRKSN